MQLQEDLGRNAKAIAGKIIGISFKATKLTVDNFMQALVIYSKDRMNHGKIGIQRLAGKEGKIENFDQNFGKDALKYLEGSCKKYGVNYSVIRQSTQPPTYTVFFKGKDREIIKQCLKDATDKWQKSGSEKSLLQKLEISREKVKTRAKEKAKEKAKDKVKDGKEKMKDNLEK